MDSNVQPSFIPKKVLTQQAQRPRHHMSLFSLIGTIIFITVLALAGVVMGAKYVITSAIEKKTVTLEAELNKFEGKLVLDLFVLDTRFILSNYLLKRHLSLSEFFKFLGKNTLKNIRFSSFNFTTASEKGVPMVSLSGQTTNFASLALQQREFNSPANAAYLKNVQIANPNLDKDGSVTFSFVADLDPDKFSYSTVIKDKGTTASSSTPATATTTASTTKATSTKATSTISTKPR